MAKKVLILSASPRKGGNSDLLCDQFAKGAEEAGHQVEKVRVQEKKIAPCLACYGCRNTGVCVQKDDMAGILDKLVKADVLVLATPVYFYSMDGQLKTLIDRTLPRYTEIRDKEVYFIATAAAGRGAMERTMDAMRGFTDCLIDIRIGEGDRLWFRRLPEGGGHGHQGVPGGLPAGQKSLSKKEG